jgi:tetratricopeptide (TPR) repeat protein
MDDAAVALEHGAVRGASSAWVRAPFYSDQHRPIWRPLATLSLRWDQLTAPSRHLPAARVAMGRVNVALFALGVLAAFGLLRVLRFGPWSAFAIAGILAVHPANLVSLLQLAGRSELISRTILLLTLALYIGAVRTNRPRRRGAALWLACGAGFLLALLGHEAALILPLLALGWEIAAGPAGRPATSGALIALGVAVLWAAAREGVLRGIPLELRLNPAFDYVGALDAGERLRWALYLPLLYAGMLLRLAPILPDYSHLLARAADAPDVVLGDVRTYGVRTLGAGDALLGASVLIAAGLLFVWLRRRNPRAAFGAWTLALGLLFSLPVAGVNQHVASARNLFLPVLGLGMLLGGLVQPGLMPPRTDRRAPGLRRAVPAAAAIVAALIGLGLVAGQRSVGRAWSSQETLMARLDAAAPRSPEVPLQRAGLAISRGDLTGAAGHLEESLGRFPRNPRVLLNLGLIRAQLQQYSVATRVLNDATVVTDRVMPRSGVAAKAHLGLGTLLARQGLEEPALEEFRKALAADSTNAYVLASAGLLEALSLETARDGIRHLDRALALDPTGQVLGGVAPRVRETRDRAVQYLRDRDLLGADYDALMNPPDSAAADPSGVSE